MSPTTQPLVDVEDVRTRIDELLTRHVARLRTVLAAASDDADVLADAVAQILTGGKRLVDAGSDVLDVDEVRGRGAHAGSLRRRCADPPAEGEGAFLVTVEDADDEQLGAVTSGER